MSDPNQPLYQHPQQTGQPPQQTNQMPPQQMGYPPQQMGQPPQQIGQPPQQMGYPPQQMGYPPQQMGYPPQQMGRPPHPHAHPYPPQAQPQPNSAATRMLIPVDRSGLAIIAGYCGLLSFLFIPAIVAIPCGVFAIKDIKKSQQTPHPKYGMGRAIFGILAGAITLILYGVIALDLL